MRGGIENKMRTLSFIVNKQIITKDFACDFKGLVPGTEGYLDAEFSFTPEWDDGAKVVKFFSNNTEFPPQVIVNNKCKIPVEATNSRAFKVTILGKRADGLRLTTNSVTVVQDGGSQGGEQQKQY